MYKIVSALCFVLSCNAAWAERTMLSGSLGTWLKASAAPELIEVLSNHPKFKSEQIHFTTLRNGDPTELDNRLHNEIAHYLTRRILREGNNDVAWETPQKSCPDIAQREAAYLVSLQVEPYGQSSHQVHLKILNVEEAIWVRGISLSWQGRLLDSEKRALADKMTSAPLGSLLNPIPPHQHQQIAKALRTQVQCTLPYGVSGAIFLRLPTEAVLQTIMAEFSRHLVAEPRLAITQDDQHATWRLYTTLTPVGNRVQQLSLHLSPSEDNQATQILGTVFLQANVHTTANIVAPEPRTSEPVRINQHNEILSALRTTKSRCKRSNDTNCMELTFELDRSSYITVFRTHGARVASSDCDTRLTRKEPGTQTYRVSLPASDNARTGIYVIASQSLAPMRSLRQQLLRAPGTCSKGESHSHQRWLDETMAVIRRYSQSFTWQAVHFISTESGIANL